MNRKFPKKDKNFGKVLEKFFGEGTRVSGRIMEEEEEDNEILKESCKKKFKLF